MRRAYVPQILITLCAVAAIALASLVTVSLDAAGQAVAPAPEEIPAQAVDVESANPDVIVGGDNAIASATTGTWTFLTRENCLDLFLTSCTSSFPSPQCPPGNPAGQSCSPLGSRCWDTISSGTVDFYKCRP